MKRGILALLCGVALLFTAQSCDKNDEPTPDSNDLLKDAMEISIQEEKIPGGSVYGNWYLEPALRIHDSKGNDLLDPDFPGNVRDNHFYLQRGDVRADIDYDPSYRKEVYFGNFRVTFGFETPTDLGYGENLLFLGICHPERFPVFDESFEFVWPERNIRKTLRYYAETTTYEDGSKLIRYNAFLDGKRVALYTDIVVE